MKRLYFKLLLALLPVIIILGVYIIKDPFQVLYHHDSYYPADGIQYVSVLKDYATTQNFLNKYDKYQYDSYIFGSSRSMYYYADEWAKHIHSDKIYHFDAHAEKLYSLEAKIRYLNERGVKMKNVMIVTDAAGLEKTSDPDFNDMKHPLLTGQSPLAFQYNCLKYYFDVEFLKQYFTFLITGKIEEDFFRHRLSNTPTRYNSVTNELSFPIFEEQIQRNRDSFYKARMFVFYKRDTVQQYSPPQIGPKQRELLYSIKKNFDENGSSYRIIISPLYDQKKMDSTDMQFLDSLFGKQYVFDFSGINDLTGSIYHYYENSHYRPFIANEVMNRVYGKID